MNAANPAVDASAQTGRYDPTALEQRWQESWKAETALKRRSDPPLPSPNTSIVWSKTKARKRNVLCRNALAQSVRH